MRTEHIYWWAAHCFILHAPKHIQVLGAAELLNCRQEKANSKQLKTQSVKSGNAACSVLLQCLFHFVIGVRNKLTCSALLPRLFRHVVGVREWNTTPTEHGWGGIPHCHFYRIPSFEPSRHQLKVSFSYDVVMIMSEGEKRGVMFLSKLPRYQQCCSGAVRVVQRLYCGWIIRPPSNSIFLQ